MIQSVQTYDWSQDQHLKSVWQADIISANCFDLGKQKSKSKMAEAIAAYQLLLKLPCRGRHRSTKEKRCLNSYYKGVSAHLFS